MPQRSWDQWESTFRAWSKPLGVNEGERCDNAERMIKAAIQADPILSKRDIEVFAQGSFRNNTNISRESDVDVCVLCYDACFTYFESGSNITDSSIGLVDSVFTYSQYKNEVEVALQAKFGKGVSRGDKAFDIHENTYRVNADVVPCFERRTYFRESGGTIDYISGTAFITDKGKFIFNFPKQHTAEGIEKNIRTGKRFKYITRALKALRCEMEDEGYEVAEPIPSFLIECMAYNTPDDHFGQDTYTADVRNVLAHVFNHTRSDSECLEWVEANGIKYLFRPMQPWTRKQLHNFVSVAWDHIGFE